MELGSIDGRVWVRYTALYYTVQLPGGCESGVSALHYTNYNTLPYSTVHYTTLTTVTHLCHLCSHVVGPLGTQRR